MVLQIDLSKEKEQQAKIEHEKIHSARTLRDKIPKASLKIRIKNKFRVWQANFIKMPLSHKVTLTFMGITVSCLIAIAIIYGFVIFTTPIHKPLDTSYKLLKTQTIKELTFLQELPTPPKVKDQENPINGDLYTQEDFAILEEKKPLLVMIENSVDARPQAGLSNADLVYETLVESGITRFMAVFWGKDAEKVGPVRSVRTYFLDWSAEYYDPSICNIGQAGYESWEAVIVPEADARSYIIRYNVKSFGWYGRSVTWRDHDKYNEGVAWEHVAYSDTQTLWEDAEILGWIGGQSNIQTLRFKKDALKEKRSLTQEIQIKFLNLGSVNSKVNWIYDKDSNTYKRYLADKPHIDENNNKQIAAKNIIIQHCKYRPTGDRNGRIVFTTTGEGKVEIFQDGKIIEGVWKKTSRTDRTKFYDTNGEEIALNRGQIWIEIVPVSGTTDLSTITIK